MNTGKSLSTRRARANWKNSTRKGIQGCHHPHPRVHRCRLLYQHAATGAATASTGQDFPHSRRTAPDCTLFLVAYGHYLRGDSLSRISTDSSANPQLSWSTTTANGSTGSGVMITLATSHLTLPGPAIQSPSSIPHEHTWGKGRTAFGFTTADIGNTSIFHPH